MGIRTLVKLFTKIQAAELLQVSTRTIDRLILRLNLPSYKVGRQVRIPEASLRLILKRDAMSPEEFQKTINDLYGD